MQKNREAWDNFTKNNPIIWKENCILCDYPKNKDDKELVLKNFDYWIVIYNKYPYWWTKDHLLAFPKRHIELTKDLNNEELKDLKNVNTFINDYFKNKDYFSFLRETYSGRSIAHLHYHYLPGKIFSEDITNILKKQKIWET